MSASTYTLQRAFAQANQSTNLSQISPTTAPELNIPSLPPAPNVDYNGEAFAYIPPPPHQHTPSTYTLAAPPRLPELAASGTLIPTDSATASSSTDTTQPQKAVSKYHDYKNIDWFDFIQSAIATGNAKAYCAAHNVCYTTYKRRQKLYNSLPDKTALRQYKKQTNIAKRALNEQQQLAVRDEFLQGIGEGTIPNTNQALMRILTKHRNAAHPDKTPVTQLGNSVIQNFKKRMGLTTIDLNKVQGRKRPSELETVMEQFTAVHGAVKRSSKKAKTDGESSGEAPHEGEQQDSSLIQNVVQSVNEYASQMLQSMSSNSQASTTTDTAK